MSCVYRCHCCVRCRCRDDARCRAATPYVTCQRHIILPRCCTRTLMLLRGERERADAIDDEIRHYADYADTRAAARCQKVGTLLIIYAAPLRHYDNAAISPLSRRATMRRFTPCRCLRVFVYGFSAAMPRLCHICFAALSLADRLPPHTPEMFMRVTTDATPPMPQWLPPCRRRHCYAMLFTPRCLLMLLYAIR